MEELIILILIAVFFAPLILSIVAIIKVVGLESKLDRLKKGLEDGNRSLVRQPVEPLPAQVPPEDVIRPIAGTGSVAAAVPSPKPEAVQSIDEKSGEKDAVSSPVMNGGVKVSSSGRVAQKPVVPRNKLNWELLMGIKGAAFLGIIILVIGISLLIAYAIQNAWLGPAPRTLLGLVSGAMMVGLGYVAELRSKKFIVLTRVLTGGGGALFFVSVYAAYGWYHLIPGWTAAIGLLACVAAIFGLAVVYQSQVVAVLGVVGAFLVPVLVGESAGNSAFLLIYVGLVNVAVILLGYLRKWQWLYNLGFLCTVFYFLEWYDLEGQSNLVTGLVASLVFYLEYAGLALLKLRNETEVSGRTLDVLRLLVGSLLLLVAVQALLDPHPMGEWMGFWFLGYALLHLGLAGVGYRWFSHFTHEILAFLAGSVLFAAMALPAQLDGSWVSLGWAIEGVILAWMAARMRSGFFQFLAFVLGLVGILKAMVFDATLYGSTPNPFLNLRFLMGLAASGLMGVQGWIAQKSPNSNKTEGSFAGEAIAWLSVLAVLLFGISDTFWTIGFDEIEAWIMVSWMLLLVSSVILLATPVHASLRVLSAGLLTITPLLVLCFGLVFAVESHHSRPFFDVWIWLELVTVICGTVVVQRLNKPLGTDGETNARERIPFETVVYLLSLFSGIGLISSEFFESSEKWGSMAVTLFWGFSAVLLTIWGLSRQLKAYRLFGLALFLLCGSKVIFVDSTQLHGLQRIGAYIGAGLLLLLLSFMYQKASDYFKNQQKLS